MEHTDQSDPHVSVSFSLPKSVKEDMDKRAKTLRISRSDYLKIMVLWELNKGMDAPFDMPLNLKSSPVKPKKKHG